MRSTHYRVAVCLLTASAALLLPGDRPADAVWYAPRIGIGYGLGYGMGGWGYGGYGWGNFGGGTAAGNYMQGAAQVIRARGQYNEQTSKAMINYEDARTKYIDNRKKWTETYFAMKEQNQARAAEKRERMRPSSEALASAARSSAPKSLSHEAFDPITGKLQWPAALLSPAYNEPREKVEQLVELHATSGAANTLEIQQAVQALNQMLRSNIQTLPPNDYIAARKFLDSLAFTVRA